MPSAELVAAERVLAAAGDPRPRQAALGALVRLGDPDRGRRAWDLGGHDPDASVRRRAAELAPRVDHRDPTGLLTLLADRDELVAEAAAAALGEIRWPDSSRPPVVGALAAATTGHDDALVREAAVAALGALADPAGLPAILTACHDRPAIRRRAVLALAPFEGPEVDTALAAALTDRDWQVRQAAEDLM